MTNLDFGGGESAVIGPSTAMYADIYLEVEGEDDNGEPIKVKINLKNRQVLEIVKALMEHVSLARL